MGRMSKRNAVKDDEGIDVRGVLVSNRWNPLESLCVSCNAGPKLLGIKDPLLRKDPQGSDLALRGALLWEVWRWSGLYNLCRCNCGRPKPFRHLEAQEKHRGDRSKLFGTGPSVQASRHDYRVCSLHTLTINAYAPLTSEEWLASWSQYSCHDVHRSRHSTNFGGSFVYETLPVWQGRIGNMSHQKGLAPGKM